MSDKKNSVWVVEDIGSEWDDTSTIVGVFATEAGADKCIADHSNHCDSSAKEYQVCYDCPCASMDTFSTAEECVKELEKLQKTFKCPNGHKLTLEHSVFQSYSGDVEYYINCSNQVTSVESSTYIKHKYELKD